jgi:hypothetical protein
MSDKIDAGIFNWNAPSWFLILGTFALILGLIVALAVEKYHITTRRMCEPFVTSNATNSVTKFNKTALYPYSGDPNNKTTEKTETECIELLTSNPSNIAAQYFGKRSDPIDQNKCWIWEKGNTSSSATLSGIFTASKVVVGPQITLEGTEVFVKHGSAYSELRGEFGKRDTA